MHEKDRRLGRKLRMTFYESSEGPCVTLFGPIDVELDALRDCFRRLSDGGGEVQLDELEFIIPFGGVTLLAECVDATSSHGSPQRRAVSRRSATGLSFVWRQSRDAWTITTELVEGLIDSPTAGHQYLSEYPEGDALILASKGEFSDRVLAEYRH